MPNNDPLKSVRRLHERHMTSGQDCLFTITDNQLQVRAEQRYWLATHRKKALRMLRPRRTDRFVDLGCGEGYITLPLAQQAGWSAGIDFAASSLQTLRMQPDIDHQRLHLLVASAERIPLPDASIDKLLCNHVLEHVLDDDTVMGEIHRVVRQRGLVLIGVPLELSPQVRLTLRLRRMFLPNARQLQLERVQAGRLVSELVGRQGHIRFYSLQAVYHMLERNGFRVLRAEGIALSLRGRINILFRRNRLLFFLGTALGRVFPRIAAGVLVLAERGP